MSSLPLGRIVLASLLLIVGVVWLLDTTDVLDVSWGALLPITLIVIGVALIVGSRTGSHSGLIVVGVVLTVFLAVASSLSVPLSGGIGDRTERPTTVEDIPRRYQLAFGSLKIDLTRLELPTGETVVRAQVGMGKVRITVPDGVALDVRGDVTGGRVVVLGEERNGFRVEDRIVVREEGAATLVLDVSLGFGSIEVEER
jgi:predicted membrane protein